MRTGSILLGFFAVLLFPVPLMAQSLPNLGNKIDYLINGPSATSLNILFLYRQSIALSNIPPTISKFSVYFTQSDFYKDHANQINYSYIDVPIDELYFGCSGSFFVCTKDNLIYNLYKSRYESDQIVLLTATDQGAHAGPIVYVGTEVDAPTLIHEFSHALAALGDEYVLPNVQLSQCGNLCFSDWSANLPAKPNLDSVGCAKWCSSYNLQPLLSENSICSSNRDERSCFNAGCTWFADPHPFLGSKCVIRKSDINIGLSCQPATGCYYGADFYQIAFRSSVSSIMNSQYLDQTFNQISRQQLNTIFSCCFPRSNSPVCQSFQSQNMNFLANYAVSQASLHNITRCHLDPGDTNIDSQTNYLDQLMLLSKFTVHGKLGFNVGDLNQDQVVNSLDFAAWPNPF